MQHIYATDKNGETREVSPGLRDTLISSGKRQAGDFQTVDDSVAVAPQEGSTGWQDQPVSVVTGQPRASGDEGVTTLEPISGDYWNQVSQTLLPNFSKAAGAGDGIGGEALGWLRDVGRLPGATVLGAGSGLGAFLGSDGSLMDRMSQGAQTMQSVMGTPTGTPTYRGNSLSDKISNTIAGIVTDPSLPLAAGTLSLGGMVGKMFASPGLSSAARAVTQGSLGAGEGALSSPGNEGLGAALGGGIGTGFPLLGSAARWAGGFLREKATPLFIEAAKPSTVIQDAVIDRTPEMLENGVIKPSFHSTIDAIRDYKSNLGDQYAKAIAANSDANVDVYSAALDAAQKAADLEKADRLLVGASDKPINTLFAQVSQNGGYNGVVPLQNALNLRKTIGSAFGDYKNPQAGYGPGVRDASANIESTFRDNINNQLEQVALGIRGLDDQMGGAHTFESLIPNLKARARNHNVGLRELLGGMAGAGAAGSQFGIPGAVLGGILGTGTSLATKTPAAAYLAYHSGKALPSLGEMIAKNAPYLIPIGASPINGIATSAQTEEQ